MESDIYRVLNQSPRSMMFTYSVYLLTVLSDLRIPELEGMAGPPRKASADVEIVLRKRRALRVDESKLIPRTTLPGGRPWLSCADMAEGYLLRFIDYADFIVSRSGDRIECSSSAPGISESAIRHLVLDQVFPLVLNLRGRESIHATAILTPRGVCAFTGPAGAGKSTLAASFAMAGHLTIADDCLGLVDDGGIRAIPGYPGLRLWSDAVRALGSQNRKAFCAVGEIKEDKMRRAIAVAVLCLGTAVALLAAADFQPLKVKTGLWQMTQTSTWTGLPPQWAAIVKNGKAINYKSCVRAKDLTTNPWTDGDDSKCVWTVLKSDGTDMEIKATACELGKEFGMTTEGIGKIHVVDSENGTGSVDMTISGNGQTIKGHSAYTGKWIGASCPAH